MFIYHSCFTFGNIGRTSSVYNTHTSDQSKQELRIQASITREVNARRFTGRHSSGTNVDKFLDIIKRMAKLSQLKFAILNRSIDRVLKPLYAIKLDRLSRTASISSDRWMSGRSSIRHKPFGTGQLMKSITYLRAQSRC